MDYTALPGINTLDLQSANRIGIQIEYGTREGLWVAKRLKDNLKISVNGTALQLDFVKKGPPDARDRFGTLILITKDLKTLNTIRAKEPYYSYGQIRLKGFKLSKLNIQVAADTEFYFDGMQVDTLRAVVGGDEYAGKAELTLPYNTTINEADFNIGINGNVRLQGAKVLKTLNSTVKASTAVLP